MNKFSAGDRVAFYENNSPRAKGVIVHEQNGMFNVRKDKPSFGASETVCVALHTQQLRKLKPKVKPEVIEFECVWKKFGEVVFPGSTDGGIYNHALNLLLYKRTKVRVTVIS